MGNDILICATEAMHAAQEGLTLEENLKLCMSVARGHWLVTNEEKQLTAAVVACMDFYGEGSKEYERLEWSMRSLNSLGAAAAGIPVDWAALAGVKIKHVPILAIWKETK